MANAPYFSKAPSPRRQVLGYGLRVRGLRVMSHVGVGDEERAHAQELVVAVELELPGSSYPEVDELTRAGARLRYLHSL